MWLTRTFSPLLKIVHLCSKLSPSFLLQPSNSQIHKRFSSSPSYDCLIHLLFIILKTHTLLVDSFDDDINALKTRKFHLRVFSTNSSSAEHTSLWQSITFTAEFWKEEEEKWKEEWQQARFLNLLSCYEHLCRRMKILCEPTMRQKFLGTTYTQGGLIKSSLHSSNIKKMANVHDKLHLQHRNRKESFHGMAMAVQGIFPRQTLFFIMRWWQLWHVVVINMKILYYKSFLLMFWKYVYKRSLSLRHELFKQPATKIKAHSQKNNKISSSSGSDGQFVEEWIKTDFTGAQIQLNTTPQEICEWFMINCWCCNIISIHVYFLLLLFDILCLCCAGLRIQRIPLHSVFKQIFILQTLNYHYLSSI